MEFAQCAYFHQNQMKFFKLITITDAAPEKDLVENATADFYVALATALWG